MATVLVNLDAEASQLDDIAVGLAGLAHDIEERTATPHHPDLDQAAAAVTQVRGIAAQLTAWADKVDTELGRPATGPDLVASFRQLATVASRDLAETLWASLSRVTFSAVYRPQVIDIIADRIDGRMQAAIDDAAGVGDPDSRIQAVEP